MLTLLCSRLEKMVSDSPPGATAVSRSSSSLTRCMGDPTSMYTMA